MTSIIKSSAFLNSLYENEVSVLEEEVDYETFINKQFLTNLQIYNQRYSQSKLTREMVNNTLNMFELLNLHNNFVKPELDEYFNKKLNFMTI